MSMIVICGWRHPADKRTPLLWMQRCSLFFHLDPPWNGKSVVKSCHGSAELCRAGVVAGQTINPVGPCPWIILHARCFDQIYIENPVSACSTRCYPQCYIFEMFKIGSRSSCCSPLLPKLVGAINGSQSRARWCEKDVAA